MKIAALFPSLLLALVSGVGTARGDVFSNVPEAADFEAVYELPIPLNGSFQGTTPVPYSLDHSATAAPAGFDRVAYYLELTDASGTKWAYTSMDAFTTIAAQTGLPHAVNNPVAFQQTVTNLTVLSNAPGVQSGSFDKGQIELWHQDYGPYNSAVVFLGNSSLYDWGDQMGSTPSGYGSFQVHNPVNRQVVFAYNRWASGSTNDDIGIGNCPLTNPDWTLAGNTGDYTARRLVILVRPKRFQVTFSEFPRNQQITQRDAPTNLAAVRIAGTESAGGCDAAVLKVWRNGVAYGADRVQTLSYTAGVASFDFSPTIPGELAAYTFELHLRKAGRLYLVRQATDVCAGDGYICYGQSNAQAPMYNGSANAYQSPWVRTFGMSTDSSLKTRAYAFWVKADGDGALEHPAGVGQWPLVLARKIVDTYGIPVAMLNGARGGYTMPELQRDDTDPDNLDDSVGVPRAYARLRYRAIQSGLASGLRGILLHTGESDLGNTLQHTTGFAGLMADWAIDYPGVERVYVGQLHVGYGVTREDPALRDAQRRFQSSYPKARILSTNGLVQHTDVTHFTFVGGYETLGINTFRMIGRALYNAPDSPEIDAPEPLRVEVANSTADRLRIVLRKAGANITVEPGALVDFRLNGSPALVLSAQPTSTGIELQYDRAVLGATGLDYLAHIRTDGGWIRNGNGIGMLTFAEPITNPFPVVTIATPAALTEFAAGSNALLTASATTPSGAITRMEVWVDGILHTASNSTNSIVANWTVPAGDAHKILFRATNAAGYTGERTVVVLAGNPAAPGGVASGLNVWLRGESGIIRDASGRVSEWRDSSGHGFDCTQSTASAQPLYTEGRFGLLPGVTFDGSDWLDSTGGMSAGSYTKIARVLVTDFSGNIISSGGGSGTPHALFLNNSPQPRVWHGATFVTASSALAAGTSYVLVATYDAASKVGELYINGTLVGSGNIDAGATRTSYQLGAIVGSNFLRGSIGEVAIYNRVLTVPEQTSVRSYLEAKAVLPPDAPRPTYASWASTNIPPGLDATATGDANRNGIPNLVEYGLGLDPAAPSSRQPLEVSVAAGTATIRYFRPTDRTGITQEVLESLDGSNWAAIPDLAGPASAGLEERRCTRIVPPGGKGFYRLRVTLTP